MSAVQVKLPAGLLRLNFELGVTLGGFAAVGRGSRLLPCRAGGPARRSGGGAYNGVGQALYAKGQRVEAIGHFKEALRLDPKSIAAHINLGGALGDGGT